MDAHLRTGHDSQVETSMPLYNCEIHCRTQSRKPLGVKTCSEAQSTDLSRARTNRKRKMWIRDIAWIGGSVQCV